MSVIFVLFFRSWMLLAYAAVFLLITLLLVVVVEEPVLRRMFGKEYQTYCARIHRWRPTRPRSF